VFVFGLSAKANGRVLRTEHSAQRTAKLAATVVFYKSNAFLKSHMYILGCIIWSSTFLLKLLSMN